MLENISNFFIGILLFLDGIIYSLISWVYQIILVICQVDILDNSYEIDALVNRIYVIIGVVVLFLVAYSLLKSMVNPDDALKNKKSPVNIIKDVIISIALIALVPTIFSFATRFQNAILMENTIGKVILGTSSNETGETSEETIEDGGITIAANLLQAFLHPNYDLCTKNDDYTYDCSNVEVATKNTIGWIPIVSFFINVNGGYNNFDSIWESILETGNFLSISSFAYSISHESNVTYYYIISTVAGVFTLFVLLSYCIDIAIRTVKLAVYQLIAPLPILSRIIPGEQGNKVFNNWIKATLSTYVEVFIRLAILFFAILLIKLIVQNLPTLLIGGGFISGNAGFTVYLFAQVFIIIGIILFIKQAPQLLKDITGLDGGKYGKALMRGIGMMTSALGGGATAAIRRAVTDKKEHPEMGKGQRFGRTLSALGGGMRRGIWQGSKVEKLGDISKAAGRTASNTLRYAGQIDAAGGGLKGTLEYYKQKGANKLESIGDFFGGNGSEENRIKQEAIAKYTKLIDSIEDIWKKDAGYIELTKTMQQLKASAHGNVEQYLAYIKQAAKELEAQGYNKEEAKRMAANRVSQDSDLQSRFGITNIVQFDQEMYDINEQQRIMDNLEAQIKVKKAPQINGILQQVYETQRAYSDLTFTENGVTRNIFGQPISKEEFDNIASTSSLQSGNPQSTAYISELIDISNNSKNINAQLSAEAVGKEARKSRMGEDKKK